MLVSSWRLLGKCRCPTSGRVTDHGRRFAPLHRPDHQTRWPAVRSGPAATSCARSRDTGSPRASSRVETPILQRDPRRCERQPFQTHINAYDLDLYLRIAPSCTLKHCALGGVEQVFEITGPSATKAWTSATTRVHPPEAYQATRPPHLDRRLPRIIQNAATAANRAPVDASDGDTLEAVDIGGEWTVKTVHDARCRKPWSDTSARTELAVLRRLCDRAGDSVPDPLGCRRGGARALRTPGRGEHHRTDVSTPTSPTSVSPLTRPLPEPSRRRRTLGDLVAWGVELGNGLQRTYGSRGAAPAPAATVHPRGRGHPEAVRLDEDFLQALGTRCRRPAASASVSTGWSC